MSIHDRTIGRISLDEAGINKEFVSSNQTGLGTLPNQALKKGSKSPD